MKFGEPAVANLTHEELMHAYFVVSYTKLNHRGSDSEIHTNPVALKFFSEQEAYEIFDRIQAHIADKPALPYTYAMVVFRGKILAFTSKYGTYDAI